ncbi:hypothetical protein INT44_009231 [Umbelopsis vinacea]|uniref:Uncharacterized protein n=1 Tax=Umbelopsis vinacea TaxID=44442 RepID=A0A8H7Q3Y3_9FUNG|nr:hypothetical protein INT44_009231 [Umbelopsis vinacea]
MSMQSHSSSISKGGHAEGTTERLNERLNEECRSHPVNEHPEASYASDNHDEGVDGSGLSWPSRTEEQQKLDREDEKKYQYMTDKFQKDRKDTEDNYDEGVDGTGAEWMHSP